MGIKMKSLALAAAAAFTFSAATAQEATKPEVDHSYKPLKLNLNEDGSKYIRFITWHQVWATTQNFQTSDPFSLATSLRRSRVLLFAQVSPRFLILTHFGLNSLNVGNMNATGVQSDGPQLFLHDAWTEFKVADWLYLGGGLHYWKGMNRLANSSTLNFMTLDATRPFIGWHSLGYTDQFARHMGIYAKGEVGKLNYRLAVNDPLINNLDAGKLPGMTPGSVVYGTSALAATGSLPKSDLSKVIEGYASYAFMDKESTKLPYAVGTYLGKKKVFNVGAGFFTHPKGTVKMNDDSTLSTLNVGHFAVDAFLDYPVGTKGDAVTAYATFMNFNFGDNNYANLWAGTGNAIYGHVGYYINKAKIQPYVSYQMRNYKKYSEAGSSLDAGINYFINGHHAKLTLEYHQITNEPNSGTNDVSQIRFQAHIFL